MAASAEAVRNWAAAHAATVAGPAPATGTGLGPTGAPRRPVPQEPVPLIVTAVTEVGRWNGLTPHINSVRWTRDEDGQLLLATGGGGTAAAGDSNGNDDYYAARIWNAENGSLLTTLTGHTDTIAHTEWGRSSDGRLLLATGSFDETARIWDSGTGQALHVLQVNTHRDIYSPIRITWGIETAGSLMLATGDRSGTIQLWNPDDGGEIRRFADKAATGSKDEDIWQIAWAQGAGEQSFLAAIYDDHKVRIWDFSTGHVICTFQSQNRVIAFGYRADGRLALVGSGGGDPSLGIWVEDNGTFTPQGPSLDGHGTRVRWARLDDGRALLATANMQTVRFLDGHDLNTVHSREIPSPTSGPNSIDFHCTPDGRLLMATTSGSLIHVWEVTLSPPIDPVEASATDAPSFPTAAPGGRPPASGRRTPSAGGYQSRQLLRLGASGLWPPLGLLSDLVTLTGGSTLGGGLHDARLDALADEPGIRHLRELATGDPQWNAQSRAAFAAVLAAGLDLPARYTPPADTSPAALSSALATALTSKTRPADAPWRAPVSALRDAANEIGDQAVTLLAILGPEACAADPMLPVRLARQVPLLPALSPRELRFLTGLASPQADRSLAIAAGTLTYSTGTAGVSRTGPLTRLLPTQIALPSDVFTTRLAEDQLLYRQHRVPSPPTPQPVTLILDTSPPTYGPAGTALRLAAHLATILLWSHGCRPALVTLDAPDAATELRATADLIRLWTTATLQPPRPALAAARETAISLGQPALLLTHHQTARDNNYVPSPTTRLLTTHQPPEQLPPPPAGPWHAHLPPEPAQPQFTNAVARLLAPAHTAQPPAALRTGRGD